MSGSGGVIIVLTIISIVNAQQFDPFGDFNFFQSSQDGRFDSFTRQTNLRQENRFFGRTTERAVPKKHQEYSYSTTLKPNRKFTDSNQFRFDQNFNNRPEDTQSNIYKTDRDYNRNSQTVSFVKSERDNNRLNDRDNNRHEDFNKPKNIPLPANLLTDPASRFSADVGMNDQGKRNGDPVVGNTRNVNVANLDFNNNNYRPSVGLTTESPLLSRPGVIPATIETGRPPLTNRPTRNNVVSPTLSSDRFGETDELPPLLDAPNEDLMTSEEKKRHTDKMETLCRKFKASLTSNIALLPLTPNAKPLVQNVSSCHVASTPLIINGKIVDIKDFPHMALVGWRKVREAGYSWKCGGSLISDQFVLTAAHCSRQKLDTEVVSGTPHAVQLGSTYLDDPGALVAKIGAVYNHPKYRSRTRYYDVAVIKLKNRLTSYSDVVRPACVGMPPPPNANIVATGWGRTEIGGGTSFELRSASLSTWDLDRCQNVYAEDTKLPNGLHSDTHICAADNKSTKKKSDTCQGDSGGPIQIQEGCVWRLVGITSFGHSCALPDTPALYAVIPRAMIGALLFPEPDVLDRGAFPETGAIFFRD